MKKPNLYKGRIYLKDGVWVVRYKTTERVRGGSPKQLGSYKLQPKVNYISIRKEDIHNLKDPYDQGKETCFELILINEIENGYKNQPSGMVGFVAQTTPVWYAKLWPTSKMAQDLQYYLETTSQEEIDKDWKKVEELDLVGPTIEEFLGIEEQHNFLPGFINQFDPKEGEINGEEWTAVHFLKWLELNKFKIVK